MAQKHNWSKKKGDAWCTRKGCGRLRVLARNGDVLFQDTHGVTFYASAGPCGGEVSKEEKPKMGKHKWAMDAESGWQPCQSKDCPWQFNARKEKYRVRGATTLGEKRKPDPCKGVFFAIPVHDWKPTLVPSVKECSRCGWQRTPSVGMLRAVGFRPSAISPWQIEIPQCKGAP